MTLSTKKKLLVLDVNGLLVERFFQADKRPEHRSPDGKVGKFYVYKRPFCEEFLTFCFEKFEVGIWSSAQQHNVQNLVDFVFGDLKSKLVFTWHQNDCTDTGLRTLENNMKPVFLKELYKLWSKLKPDLPWEEGDYGPFNTLLIDDTPYKAMRNPPHTAIFPYPYEVSNDQDDALGGALRKYLEGIAGAINVQDYVKYHPFGQLPISQESPEWHFYRDILFVRLPTVNGNSSSIVETKVNGVTNKTLAFITYNCGSTQSSSSQQCSVPSIEREDNGLTETAVTCMTERNGTIATTLSQKHTILNGLEENGVAKATQPTKKKRKSAMQAVLKQEHEAHNISLVDEEAAFGISQQSDLDEVSKHDVLIETAVTCATENNGVAVTTLSHKHVNLNGPDENDVDKVTNYRKKRRTSVIEGALNQEHEDHNSSVVDNPMKKRRNSVMETALNQEHEAHNSSVVDNPSKKRRSSVMEAVLNQEHEAHNSSVLEKEAVFGILQQSDLHMVSKDYGWSENAMTCMTERNGTVVTTLNQKHATLNGLYENKEVDSQTDKYHVGNNTLKRSGRGFRDARCSTRGHHYKARHFNKNYGNCSNHRPSVSFHTNSGGSRTYHPPRRFEGNCRHQNDVNATLQTQVAHTGNYAQTNTGRSQTSHFPRNIDGNWRQHQTDASSTLQTQVTQAQTNTGGSRTYYSPRKFERQVARADTYAQINTAGSRTSQFTRKSEGNWRRHQIDASSNIQTQVAQVGSFAETNTGGGRTYHFPSKFERKYQNNANATLQTQVAQAGTYCQTNYGGSRTSHFPNWHQNDVNLQTQVAQAGAHDNNNAFGKSVVPENLVVYQGGAHTNGGQCQSWANQHSNSGGGSYGAHHQNYNHLYKPHLFSHSYSKGNDMRQKSNDMKIYRSNKRYY